MHILCLHRHTHTHTALGQDLTNGCCRTYWWWWVFPLCRGRTRCSRSAFIPPDQGQAKVLPPSQSSEITQPCLLRESHNTHNTQPPVKQLQLSQVLLILLSTALWCWFFFKFFFSSRWNITVIHSSIYVRFLFLTWDSVSVCIGVRQGEELVELNACFFCATMCCRLVSIKLKWLG